MRAKQSATEALMPRQRARQTIQRMIDDGRFRPGERLPSDRELATLCQVSRMTARAAIQEMEESQLLDRIPGKGCRVRSTKNHWLMSRTVAVLSRQRAAGANEVAHGQETYVQESAIRAIEEHGYHCLLLNPDKITSEWQTRFLAERPLGIIASASGAESPAGQALAAAESSHGIPVAVYGDLPALQTYSRVVSDHFAGGRDLVFWLAARGRRKLLRFWTVALDSYWLDRRNAGCESALHEAGLEVWPEVRISVSDHQLKLTQEVFDHDVHVTLGYLYRYLKDPALRPDAILAANDIEAARISAACSLYGIGAPEILITGYDNFWPYSPYRSYTPGGPTVTVDKNHAQVGRELANLVLNPSPERPRRIVIPHQIVELTA